MTSTTGYKVSNRAFIAEDRIIPEDSTTDKHTGMRTINFQRVARQNMDA